jgi:hypothetical protein
MRKLTTVLISSFNEAGKTKEVNFLTTTAIQMSPWRKKLFEEKVGVYKNFLTVKWFRT